MPVLDRAEALAIAALVDHIRYGSALPIRRPSYTSPTFLSRPVTATKAIPVNPTPITVVDPDPAWTDIVAFTAPVQYFSRISSWGYAVLGTPDPAMEFRLLLNGTDLSDVTLPDGVNICKADVWPIYPRKICILLNQNDRLVFQARNGGAAPQTVVGAFWGWSYPTTDVEFSSLANKGITDA